MWHRSCAFSGNECGFLNVLPWLWRLGVDRLSWHAFIITVCIRTVTLTSRAVRHSHRHGKCNCAPDVPAGAFGCCDNGHCAVHEVLQPCSACFWSCIKYIWIQTEIANSVRAAAQMIRTGGWGRPSDLSGCKLEEEVFLSQGLLWRWGIVAEGFLLIWQMAHAWEVPSVSLMLCVLSSGPAICQFRCPAPSVMSCNEPAIRVFEVQASRVPWDHY